MLVPFVGRVGELEAVRVFNSRQAYLPLFVFGPEGCGKTKLFREVVSRFSQWFSDGIALYINRLVES